MAKLRLANHLSAAELEIEEKKEALNANGTPTEQHDEELALLFQVHDTVLKKLGKIDPDVLSQNDEAPPTSVGPCTFANSPEYANILSEMIDSYFRSCREVRNLTTPEFLRYQGTRKESFPVERFSATSTCSCSCSSSSSGIFTCFCFFFPPNSCATSYSNSKFL